MKYFRVALLSLLALVLLLLFIGGGVAWYVGLHDRGINLNFDPAAVAASETRMWRHYYAGKGREMGMEMMNLMREQFGASLKTAYEVCEPMARGAMAFHRAPGANAREQIMPHLEESYARLAKACGKDWDANALAEAEFAWWAARRTPGQDSPEQVGALIANLYSLMYGTSNPDIERAGLLRAQAAALRDAERTAPDWPQIESLLVDSYTALHAGINPSR